MSENEKTTDAFKPLYYGKMAEMSQRKKKQVNNRLFCDTGCMPDRTGQCARGKYCSL